MKKAVAVFASVVALCWIIGATMVHSAGDDGKEAGELLVDRDKAERLVKELTEATLRAENSIEELDQAMVPGTIIAFAGPAKRPKDIPDGWLLCDGTVYDGTDERFARLYNYIGTTWGTINPQQVEAPDKNDTPQKPFRVPDLRGRFLRGVSHESGNDPDAITRTDLGGKTVIGNAAGSYQGDQVGPHKHPIRQTPHTHGVPVVDGDKGENHAADGDKPIDARPPTDGANANIEILSNGTTETRPKNAAVNYLIKL